MRASTAALSLLIPLILPAVAAAQTGGPNTFGYEFAPTLFDPVPVPIGEAPLSMFDDSVVAVTLPWAFSWYGVDYTTVQVGDNGGVSFVSTSIAYSSSCLPATGSAPDIAIFWDDLNVGLGGSIYAWHDTVGGEDRFVVSWEDIQLYYSTGDGITFQIQLYPSGRVELHWDDTTFSDSTYDDAANATIGIQQPGGLDPLEFSCSVPMTLEGTASEFSTCSDVDGDGFEDEACGGLDCDDSDPAVSPAAPEVCGDGIDDNCDSFDGVIDGDGDGWVNAECIGGDDCDDSDPAINPSVDADGDGFDACADCNEAFAFINPGATEVCGDAIDQDCSGIDEQPDADFDGYTSEYCGGDDCADTNPAINPGVDVDEDGFDACEDCDDSLPDANPDGAEVCNGIDDDCSGVVDDLDADGDGDFPVACGGGDCDDSDPTVGAGTDGDGDGFDACEDCDDSDSAVYPDAPEVCDSVDSDCDGLEDGEDLDVGGITEPPLSVSTTTTFLAFCAPTIVTFSVSGTTADVFDLDVTLDISIDPTSDLAMTLESPAGTSVLLADGVGDAFASPNFTDTVFDDDATTPIADGSAPFTGSFLPAEALGAFYGEDPDGTWTLTLDSYCIAFGGTVNAATLDFELASPDDADDDGWNACGDCDSADPTVYPGAPEVCLDGIDQDCDGDDATGDIDGDTYIDAACGGDDCDDDDAEVNPSVDDDGDGSNLCEDCDDDDPLNYPGNGEFCGDGIDQNCDGADDIGDADGDGFTNVECIGGDDCDDTNSFINPGVDVDGDGWSVCEDCNDNSDLQTPGEPEVCGDFIDNNCDDLVDDVDEDEDGYHAPDCGGDDCDDADPDINPGIDDDGDGSDSCTDCNDADATVLPGGDEVCGDGLDQDCDGADLPGDVDGDGAESFICGGDDCDDTDPAFSPDAEDLCDGVDLNCDSETWEVDEDGDGYFDADCGGEDCDDTSQGVHPLAPEICNGVDDNCDGTLFEGGEDDVDDDGIPACDGDCDDEDAEVFPGADEQCNGQDDNCDEVIDEGIVVDADGDGHDKIECGGDDCEDLSAATHPEAVEDCADGFDNDCDGLGDLDDEDCDFSTGPDCSCSGSLADADAPTSALALIALGVLGGGRRRRHR